MATLRELVYDLQNLKSAGRKSDDSLLSDRQVAFIINSYRLVILKQDLQKGRRLNQETVQNLGNVKVKKVNPADCGCEIANCHLYKVESTLPKTLEVDGDLKLTFVGSIHGKSFQKTSFQRLPYDLYSKYTAGMNKWFKIGEELYIVSANATLGKTINVQGIFEDPLKASEYRTCLCENDETCTDGWDSEYPLPLTMWDTVKKLIMDAELKFMDSQVNDSLNNSKDESSPSI